MQSTAATPTNSTGVRSPIGECRNSVCIRDSKKTKPPAWAFTRKRKFFLPAFSITHRPRLPARRIAPAILKSSRGLRPPRKPQQLFLVTVQIPMVVDFRGGGGWARAGAGDGNEPQSVN